MLIQPDTWAVVLAAGEGTRLRALTTDATGKSTPKQYCSLFGGPTLVQDALNRAASVVPTERVCAIVAVDHAQWWQEALAMLPRNNVILQPRNRGTGIGVLLSVCWIAAHTPDSRLLFVPSDHFVENEARLADAMRRALRTLKRAEDALVMVGIEPEEADPELGYVVPGEHEAGSFAVRCFAEKPMPLDAMRLMDAGALWNSFIFAATAGGLLELFRGRIPHVTDAVLNAVRLLRADSQHYGILKYLYAHLPDIDFSRDIVAGLEGRLRVVATPRCGWSDLGTPRRIRDAVRKTPAESPRRAVSPVAPLARASLAEALAFSRFTASLSFQEKT